MRKVFTLILAFCLPVRLAYHWLNLLGHKVHRDAKIGFSLLWIDRLYMGEGASIGHFNLLMTRKLLMREKAFMKKFNRIRGPINIILGEGAAISNSNSIYRAGEEVNLGVATLKLGKLGMIVSQNKLDLTRDITLGDYSTVGGHGGQFWTHGYVHEERGKGRIRVDGEILIGDNVYVGSRCTFNPGIYVADGVSIGANACIAKSLLRKGMYVAQPLRWIPQDIEEVRTRLNKIAAIKIEEVYEKPIAY